MENLKACIFYLQGGIKRKKEDQPNKRGFSSFSFCVLAFALEASSVDANTRKRSVLTQIVRAVWACLLYSKSIKKPWKPNNAAWEGFVCCTHTARRSTMTVNLLYAALFAIREKQCISFKSALFVAPIFAMCHQGKVCQGKPNQPMLKQLSINGSDAKQWSAIPWQRYAQAESATMFQAVRTVPALCNPPDFEQRCQNGLYSSVLRS